MEVILLFSFIWAVLIIASIFHMLVLGLQILKRKRNKRMKDINMGMAAGYYPS